MFEKIIFKTVDGIMKIFSILKTNKPITSQNTWFIQKLTYRLSVWFTLNILNYIPRVWYDDNIITPNIISNGFIKAGIINNVYTNSEEDKINNIYEYDLYNDIINIEDDLGISLNINQNLLEKNIDSEDENSEEEIDTEKDIFDGDDKVKNDNYNQESFDYKKELNNFENKFHFYYSSKMDIDSD